MDWSQTKELVGKGAFAARDGWDDGCWIFKRDDGKLGVRYRDRKATQYRSYRSNERATDWYLIEKPVAQGAAGPGPQRASAQRW